jgi:UDP-glucuronate 4-epimerase
VPTLRETVQSPPKELIVVKILVTGAAGFIGSTLCHVLLARGDNVVGLDNLNDYYDPALKQARLDRLTPHPQFTFVRGDLVDRKLVEDLINDEQPERVVNLAAQAGVRYSIENPHAYVETNLVGFLNILDACRHANTPHFVYASTSSVYGASTRLPFSVHESVDHPLSLYAATKRSNELMAHCYSHLYKLPTTGLRFFTVYGPWGRPDMALFIFAKAILNGDPIQIFNYGKHRRDFTYVDDIVNGVMRVMDVPATANDRWTGAHPDPATSAAPYRVYNIGNNASVELSEYISTLESCLGQTAIKEYLPLQPGDVPDTLADVDDLVADFAFSPNTSVQDGVRQFVEWYRDYYEV